MEIIIVLSSTIQLDPIWKHIADLDNVVISDKANNEIIENILEECKSRFNPDKPGEFQCLIVIDDFGNSFRRAGLKHSMDNLYTRFRHFGGNLITSVQSLNHLENIMKSNSTQWVFFDTNHRALRKIAEDLSTNSMHEKELEKFISENTMQRYSHVYIDYTAPEDQVFRIGFDRVYKK